MPRSDWIINGNQDGWVYYVNPNFYSIGPQYDVLGTHVSYYVDRSRRTHVPIIQKY